MKPGLRQALALAGIAQSAWLTNQIGQHGVAAEDRFNTALDSLFVMQPNSTEEIFGGVSSIKLGLEIVLEMLDGGDSLVRSPEVLRYMLGTLQLEAQINRRQDMLAAIINGLEAISRAYPETAQRHEEACFFRIAGLYQSTVSTLPRRIQVKGNYQFLNNDFNAARIRVMLLAGIRAALLWRQVGGRRWKLVLQRRQLREDIHSLLARAAQ